MIVERLVPETERPVTGKGLPREARSLPRRSPILGYRRLRHSYHGTRMFTVTHWWGDQERNPSEDQFARLIAELRDADHEHPDCWLTHESGWGLSYSRGKTLVLKKTLTSEGGVHGT